MLRSALVLSTLLLCLSCSDDEPGPGRFTVTTGQETDVWGKEPAAVTVEVDRFLLDGSSEPFATLDAPAPGETLEFDMGSGTASQFMVRGLDRDGELRVRGVSWFVEPRTFSNTSLPLFVGRSGSFARPDGELFTPQGERPVLANLGGRFLLALGGTQADAVVVEGFDLGQWRVALPSLIPCPESRCEVESAVVLAGSIVVAFGQEFGVFADYASGTDGAGEAELGSDVELEEFLGGAGVHASDGSAYIVGATRRDNPTTAVLRFLATGEMTVHRLDTPRAGAAATFIEGVGLLVVGGSSTGAGAELLSLETLAFESLNVPADATTGAAVFAFDERRVLRVGGRLAGETAPSVLHDFGCEQDDCAPDRFVDPIALDGADVFRVDDESLLVVGDGPDGVTAAARIWPEKRVEAIPLRTERRGASATVTGLGYVAVVGGVDAEDEPVDGLELFIP